MRGTDHQQSHMFSYLSPEARVRKDHPLRAIRTMVDEVLRALSPQFDRMYASEGRRWKVGRYRRLWQTIHRPGHTKRRDRITFSTQLSAGAFLNWSPLKTRQ